MSYTDPRTLLINVKTREPLKKGDKVTTFKGEAGVITDFTPPRHEASSGRVYCNLDEDVVLRGDLSDGPDMWTREFFPSVIDAKFIDPKDFDPKGAS